MSLSRIRAALETRLAQWATAQKMPVVWENVSGAMPNVNHLRAFLLPADTAARDMAGENRSYRGLFQVSVFTLPGKGAGPASQIAGALDDLFPVSLRLTTGGLVVQIMTPMAAKPAVVETDWYSLPLDCRYAAEETKQ